MRYTITNIPNNPATRAAVDSLKPANMRHRARGRGPRYHGGRYYPQSLPLPLAERLTIYGESVTVHIGQDWRGKPWRYETVNGYSIDTRADFRGIDPDGRVRLRILNSDS